MSGILDRLLGPKPSPSEIVGQDPLDPTDTGEMYNRIENPEGFPDVTQHIGFRRPHATASGIDTFYGLDRAQPGPSADDGAGVESDYTGIDAVADGVKYLEREARAEMGTRQVRVNPNGSGRWGAQTFWLDNTVCTQIVFDREGRGDTVITNWSSSAVYVSPAPFAPGLDANPMGDIVQVGPNGGSRTVRTEYEIWAAGTSAAVASQQVDVQQEFG